MRPLADAKIIRSAEVEPVPFGPLAEYRRLTGQDGMPIYTGVQTCAPGYATPMHWHPYVASLCGIPMWHPYVKCLFVLEGEMEAWLEGQEASPRRLGPGDMIALPAMTPHVFRAAGDGILRILGIHASPERIVHVVTAPV